MSPKVEKILNDKLFLMGQAANSHILEIYPRKKRKFIPCASFLIQKEIWFVMFDENDEGNTSLTNCIEEAALEYFQFLRNHSLKGERLSNEDANKIELIYLDSQGMWSRVHFKKPIFNNPLIGVNQTVFQVQKWEHVNDEFLNLFKILASGK